MNLTENLANELTKEEREALKTLVIDESNFSDYFFDVDRHGPQKGQVLACYESSADFIDGNMKRDIIHLLLTNEKAGETCPRLMQKLAKATPESAIQVIKDMTKDLLSGMGTDAVAEKPYHFDLRAFYYTWKECMPEHDRHWWSSCLIDVRQPDNEQLEKLLRQYNDKNGDKSAT